MITYRVTEVSSDDRLVMVSYAEAANPSAAAGGVHILWETVDNYMALYGLDPEGALDAILHVVPAEAAAASLDPRDDPAVVQGWVTTMDPDAEPVQCYTARSTADARGAFLARIDAHKADGSVFTDPDGLLTGWAVSMHVPERHKTQCQWADVTRWLTVYGDLPVSVDDPLQKEATRA